MAPILPYTSEEVYKLLKLDKESVHLENNPEIKNYENSKEILEKWDKFFMVKDDVYKALELARNEKLIGKGLEAKVYLNVDGEYEQVIKSLEPYLKQLFIVSEVILTKENLNKYNVCQVKIEKFEGCKCERCWNYYTNEDMVGNICKRCDDILKK